MRVGRRSAAGAHVDFRVGIMLHDLVAEEMRLADLIEDGHGRRGRLMASNDAIGDRHGR